MLARLHKQRDVHPRVCAVAGERMKLKILGVGIRLGSSGIGICIALFFILYGFYFVKSMLELGGCFARGFSKFN